MEIVRGRSVLKRTAVGRLQYYEKEEPSVVRRQVEDTERELSRYERALEQAENELHQQGTDLTGTINLGVVETGVGGFMMEMVAKFRDRYPGV